MDHNDRQAIEGLFQKLAAVEQSAPARDGEADAFIADRIGRQPGAPYFMAQTIVVQEQALEQAQARIEQLEAQVRQGGAQQGGFFGKLFGGAPVPPAPQRPAASPFGSRGHTAAGASPFDNRAPGAGSPFGNRPAGGGFLAGAAQTAMGVAGGVLLANAVGSMFAGEAEAAEPEPEPEEDMGFDDGGFDDSEF